MRPQVRLVSEGARALRAAEGFFAGVGSHVALQQPRPREALAALGALAGQRVGADVHLEGGLGVVGLVAVRAGDVTLDLVGAVQLFVLGEA